MAQIIRALKWPSDAVRQAWEDYQVGRATRQKNSNETCNVDPEEEAKGEEGTSNQCTDECKDQLKDQCKNNTPPVQPFTCIEGEQGPRTSSLTPAQRTWRYQKYAEFPWYIKQVVYEESNWRGTWVLQVKDMVAMNWEPSRREGGRGKWTLGDPTRQLPFPIEGQSGGLQLPSGGGQDDLMVWLGKS